MILLMTYIESLFNFGSSDGGNSDAEAVGCSGGSRDDDCFSSRLMWRKDGAGELYTYLPPDFTENQAVCNVPPFSTCNDVYGASVGRGSFTWKTGARTTVSQRVRLNDPGVANGELQLWADGVSVVNVSGLVMRNSSSGRIRGMMFQTFFGGMFKGLLSRNFDEFSCRVIGSDSSWASPTDQQAFFSDLTVAITETL